MESTSGEAMENTSGEAIVLEETEVIKMEQMEELERPQKILDFFRPEIYGDFQKSPYISGLKMSKNFCQGRGGRAAPKKPKNFNPAGQW